MVNAYLEDGRSDASNLRARIGGKGAQLHLLQSLDLPVPEWTGITTLAFNDWLGEHRETINQWLSESEPKWAAVASKIQALLDNTEIPEAVWQAIQEPLLRLAPDTSDFLAIRSSAIDEDGAGESFAGLHDSLLFIRGEAEIRDAIKQVWRSVFNERALSYRAEKGLRLKDLSIAVIVQKMIPCKASGVMFTADPISGDALITLINGVWGLGEGLVSAGFDADQFLIHKRSGEHQTTVLPKTEQMVFDTDKGCGIRQTEVPADLQEKPCLSDEQLTELAAMGSLIEKAARVPQDIEFGIDQNGRCILFQTRAITTLQEYGPAAGFRQVWDNSNIIESYSGVTSPMTFSFIRRAYTIVYNCFCEVMGIPGPVIAANQKTFANMLGLFRGEVFYNLPNWYRLIKLFPGYNYNRSFMESMMGVSEPLDDGPEPPPRSAFKRYFVDLPDLLKLLSRTLWNFARIRKRVDTFQSSFKGHYERWSAMDFDRMPPHELMDIYDEMEEEVLWNWQTPIINDFFVMIFYGTLKKLCSKYCGDEQGTLQNDLLCGEGGIESTEPTKRLLGLARMAFDNPALKALLLEGDVATLGQRLADAACAEAFCADFEAYLDAYGFRCMNELKLEEPSLKDRPDFVYQVIRNYLKADDPSVLDLQSMEKREAKIRAEAEGRAFGLIRNPLRKIIFIQVLTNARLGVKNRENLRFARTKIYGLLRELLKGIGGNWANEGILEEKDDIFFLDIQEVWNYIRGTAVTTRLKELVALRKAEFQHYRDTPDQAPEDRFETFGPAYHKNRYKNSALPNVEATDGALRGTGCCPGVVEGEVRVLLSPQDDMELNGEILVAARTDPGWVPLYPSVSGLLIERGSILSHSAIVAREMGIPTIVGIPGLIESVKSGQRVSMNGATGEVEVLDEN